MAEGTPTIPADFTDDERAYVERGAIFALDTEALAEIRGKRILDVLLTRAERHHKTQGAENG